MQFEEKFDEEFEKVFEKMLELFNTEPKTIEEITEQCFNIPKEQVEKWYEKMMEQYESDCVKYNTRFEITKDWDRDFRKALGIWEE